ncbi:beta-lactamase-like protein [Roridomyces roridus]|uniref:Beta-lactamase-like protein n=1 Tax=Roridomyces roridus TaxID=1738132 RepID=A0AAD7FKY5_9AGAR|nr:beta-lactamase-like protein [Roridomyces roridus]
MSSSIECILLGTGTSSSVPSIDCITAHAIPGSSDRPPCRTCLSTIDGSAEGKKNIRRNTSAILRLPGKEGSVTVLIDCGKNFQAAALEWFPKYGVRRNRRSVNGLDDLRAWTLGGKIQPHIDLYVSQSTYQDIKQMFPYLVSKEFASGGGDIPEFVWHVCIEDGIPFEIVDTSITVTPFLVNHGRLFTKPDPVPAMEQLTLQDGQAEPPQEIITPYMCMAFRIQEDIVYISDCGAIPDNAWPSLLPASGRQLPVCILDCLHLRSHPSHFGLDQSVIAARKINAKRTYLLGFSHEVSHEDYVAIGEVIGGAETPVEPTEHVAKGLTMIGEGEPIWLRPAHDGLRIHISQDHVTDETYD